jgi:hypothetical protein
VERRARGALSPNREGRALGGPSRPAAGNAPPADPTVSTTPIAAQIEAPIVPVCTFCPA